MDTPDVLAARVRGEICFWHDCHALHPMHAVVWLCRQGHRAVYWYCRADADAVTRRSLPAFARGVFPGCMTCQDQTGIVMEGPLPPGLLAGAR
jgi:hypothetical protein